jgi:hypothetical protein
MKTGFYEEAQKYYARMKDVLERAGYEKIGPDDIIELMVIFTEDQMKNGPISYCPDCIGKKGLM